MMEPEWFLHLWDDCGWPVAGTALASPLTGHGRFTLDGGQG